MTAGFTPDFQCELLFALDMIKVPEEMAPVYFTHSYVEILILCLKCSILFTVKLSE